MDGDRGRTVGSPGATGGVLHPLSFPPSTVTSATASSVLPRVLRATHGIRDGSSGPLTQGVCSGCSTDARILQPPLCGPQGIGRVPSSHRPFPTQCLCSYVSFQDGNSSLDPGFGPPGRLDVHHRSQGCIFTSSCTSRQPAVSSFCLGRSQPAIQDPLLWPLDGTSSIYTYDGTSGNSYAPARHPPSPVSGRLAVVGSFPRGSAGCSTELASPVHPPEHHDQLRQISLRTNASDCLLRNGNTVTIYEGFSHTGKDTQLSPGASQLHVFPSTASQDVAVVTRSHGILDSPSSGCTLKDACPTTSASSKMGQKTLRHCHPHRLASFNTSRSSLVGRGETSVARTDITSSYSRVPSFHRRLHHGLGLLPPQLHSRRTMDTRGGYATHQRAGTTSGGESLTPLSTTAQRPVGGTLCGQYHCISIPQTSRGYEIKIPKWGGSKDPAVGREPSDLPQDSIHQRSPECGGRRSKQTGTSSCHRVDASPGGLQRPVETVGSTIRGSVCHKPEFPAAGIRVTVSRSHGNSHGRLPIQLEPEGVVCLSSNGNNSTSDKQAPDISGHVSDSDCPILAQEGVVPRPPAVVGRCSTPPPTATRPATTATLSQVPPRSPVASADRVETVQRFLLHGGYSRRVAAFLARAHRPSTVMNYQSKWQTFRRWCKRTGHTSSKPSSHKFAEFLLYLHQDRHLSLSAIKGYKAMLQGVFSHRGVDLSSDQVLSSIIRACSRQVCRSGPKVPSWNLDVVLRALLTSPFEPMATADMRNVTMKTIFLVALATAKRVGELQALSAEVSKQGDDLILSYLPEFIAKTETPLHPLPRDFVLRSLSGVLGPEDEERLLCPVRALRWYQHRTQGLSRPRHLFVSVRDCSRPMSKAAISFFVRHLIKVAHQDFPDKLASLLKVRAHEVRAVATSLLWNTNRNLSDVMEAACWRTPSVFANHYLRLVQRSQGDSFGLGPVVAAGGVVP